MFHNEIAFNAKDKARQINGHQLRAMANETHQRMMETDVVQSGYKPIHNSYEDLFMLSLRYHGPHLLNPHL